MIVLVTGSSGYVGSFLVPALQRKGFEVIGTDRVEPARNPPDAFFQGDLLNDQTWENIFARYPDIDMIIHLSAAKDDWGISDADYFEQNAGVTKKLLGKADAHGVRKHFFYSTVSVYGSSEKALCEDAPKNPGNAYGQSKLDAENLYRSCFEQGKCDAVTIIRPSVIYVKYHYTNVFRFIDAIYRGKFIMIGDVNNIKTTSYIENVVEATLFLFKKTLSGWQEYNYVDEPKLTTGGMTNLIYEYTGKKRWPFSLPLNFARPLAYVSDIAAKVFKVNLPITAARIDKFCSGTNFDATAIRRLGYNQPYSNEEAFRKTIKWQIKHNY